MSKCIFNEITALQKIHFDLETQQQFCLLVAFCKDIFRYQIIVIASYSILRNQ